MSFAPALPVRTPRLVVRPLTAADAPALTAYRSIPGVCRYVPFLPQALDVVLEKIRGDWSRTALEAEGDALLLAVEVAATGAVVGDVMLRWVSAEHRCAEVGYVVHPAHGGQGYATEATHALLHLAFDDMALHRAIARVDARNTASAAVLTRLGMRQEAYLVSNEWFKGEWTDELDFALLEDEWRGQHASPPPWCAAPAQPS